MDAALNGESKVGKKATLDDSLKWGELKDLSDAYESPKGVNTMRMQKGNPVEQFGNPFMGTYRGGKKPAKSQPGQIGLFDEALPYDNQTSFPTIKEATDALLGLMNDMPKAQKQFDLAKESIMKKIETERIIKTNIFWTHQRNLDRGIDYDIRKDTTDDQGKAWLEKINKIKELI